MYPGTFTFPGPVTLGGATGAPFAVGNCTLVQNLNAELLGGLRARNFWQFGGNAGTTAGTHFLGATDNQSVEFKVNGVRALRLEPNATSPNLVGGFSGNSMGGFAPVGVTIAGGGASGLGLHSVGENFSTVGGGSGNRIEAITPADAAYNTIAGGRANGIGGDFTTYNFIGGGSPNHQPRDDRWW